jgi:hypothetical protein
MKENVGSCKVPYLFFIDKGYCYLYNKQCENGHTKVKGEKT